MVDKFLDTDISKKFTEKHKKWKTSRLEKPGWFPIFNEFLDQELLKKISGNGLKLYIYLGIHSKNDTGVSWHSLKTMAEYFGKSERTISTWLEELKKYGLIERIQPERNTSAITYLKPYNEEME